MGAAIAAQIGWTQESSGITDSVFSNPGARSIGLGGAFAAIADDATAAFANPAGLIQILRPELSAELRATVSTATSGAPYELASGISGLGFFSFVYPSRKMAFAMYSHQHASLDFTFNYGSPVTREFSVRSYSAATAFQISENLSVGAGVSYFDGDRSSATDSAGISDVDWGVNAGILLNASPAWKVAGFYRQGPEFESDLDSGRKMLQGAPNLGLQDIVSSRSFSFPDEYGVGVSFRPKGGGWTIGFEWDRVGSAVDPQHFGHTVTEGGSEYHVGAEYAVLRWKPVTAFRAGYWLEPGRRRDLVGGSDIVATTTTDDLKHVAFGLGFAFKRFQIDAGIDISERTVVASVSIVYSF